jgi:Uma2 family endonuclease
MNWQEVCEHPLFRDTPFKIETNKWGKIEMSPASNEHGLYQALLISELARLGQGGQAISECTIQTHEGVKVADVAWGSYQFFQRNKRANPYQQAPEIVIEILSPSNTRAEMNEKKNLYFEQGAQEVWLCDKNGEMVFFSKTRQLVASAIVVDFPTQIEIDFA